MTCDEIKNMTDDDLRLLIGRTLNPGPWQHEPEDDSSSTDGIVQSCGKECGAARMPEGETWGRWTGMDGKPMPHCPIPDPFDGPLEVAAERLVKMDRMFIRRVDGRLLAAIMQVSPKEFKDREEPWRWFAFDSSPADKCRVCLLTLEEQEP